MINIVSNNEVFATIGFGWEDLKFYKKWIGDKKLAADMKGPSLEFGGMQSKYAMVFLNLLKDEFNSGLHSLEIKANSPNEV